MLKEKIDHEDLVLYEVLRNPILNAEFIRNIGLDQKYDKPEELSWYQREMVADFNPYVSICTARATGKTYSLVSIITWILTFGIFPDDYILYVVPAKVHLQPVWEGLTRGFRHNNFLKNFVHKKSGINASDFTIKLLNSQTLLCRIAGQSGTGSNVIGLHTPFILTDEGGYFPHNVFQEMQPSLNTFTQGFREMVAGVPTGMREKNVLYTADRENSNYTKHRVSAYDNPRVTEEDEKRAIEQYGGKDTEDFIHYFLGEHGKPVFALFDRNLFEIRQYPVYKLDIDGIKIGDNMTDYTTKLDLFPKIEENNAGIIFGIDLGYCYSEDTEVLTSSGWKRHDEISVKDKIACFDTKKDKIVWDDFNYLWEQDYEGKMIEVSGKSTNFMVSPEHSVWIDKNATGTYKKLKAKNLKELNGQRFAVKISSESDDIVGEETFEVPYYYSKRKDREKKNNVISMSDWLEFLGWFIPEGSATENSSWEVNLTQQKGDYSDKIDSLMSKLPYTISRREFTSMWGKQQIEWRITCKELCIWLNENCGHGAKNKRIPEFIFNTSKKNREVFLKSLLYGDGSRVNSNRSPQYNSQSETLIDQVQRLAISLGYASSKGYYEKGNMYRCSIMSKNTVILERDKNVKEVNYKGKIYCLNTNQGFYVTRRNGKVAIQGNTEPTAMIILYINMKGEIVFHGRIKLQKVSYPIQKKIIDHLDTRFNPMLIGIDRGQAGIPVTQGLMEETEFVHKEYSKRMYPIDFSSWTSLGNDLDGNEMKVKTKEFVTSVLQEYSNNHKLVYSSTDPDMIIELERMTYTKTPNGQIVYRTLTERGGKRGEDHFTSALLCGVGAYHLTTDFILSRPKKKLMKSQWVISR